MPQNASFGNQIGLNQPARGFGNPATASAGYTVAVIDTGIDYNNPDLGGGWGKRVIGGYDFYNNDSDPMDDNGHGTNVAGIIGASDSTYSGVAPNVDFVALKVLGADGSGTFGMVSNALDWVIANRTKYNIVAINMSLGSGNYTVDPYTFLEGDMQALVASGVFIGVASGNDYYTYQAQGLAFPAISPNAVSVGLAVCRTATYGSVGWGQRCSRLHHRDRPDHQLHPSSGPNLDILAPGAMITSTYLGNTFKAMAGTSMATPVIVGSAVVIREELDLTGHSNLDNQSSILGIMQSTGVTVVDNDAAAVNVPTTGLTFKRINLEAAVQYVEGLSGGNTGGGGTTSSGGPTLAAIGTQNVGLGGIVAVGLNATDPAGKQITLTANLIGYNAASALAYTLKQSLGLTFSGSYFTNSWGKNEKWLEGAGGTYYAILPNGEFRKWTGTLDSMMSPANLIATLDPSVYADPSLLWNAAPATAPPLTLAIVGNQLTISAGQTAGTYTVDVTASDGSQSTDQKFSVVVIGAANGTVDHAPKVWTTIADKTMHNGTLTVPLTATDPDGDKVTFSASVTGATGIGLVVSGKNLAISPPTGYQGSFTVTVTASDGQISSSTTFHVTVGNTPPTLTVPATVTATAGAKTANLRLHRRRCRRRSADRLRVGAVGDVGRLVDLIAAQAIARPDVCRRLLPEHSRTQRKVADLRRSDDLVLPLAERRAPPIRGHQCPDAEPDEPGGEARPVGLRRPEQAVERIAGGVGGGLGQDRERPGDGDGRPGLPRHRDGAGDRQRRHRDGDEDGDRDVLTAAGSPGISEPRLAFPGIGGRMFVVRSSQRRMSRRIPGNASSGSLIPGLRDSDHP